MTQVNRMYHLIDDLREYSRLRPMPEKLTCIDLAQLIPQIIQQINLPTGFRIYLLKSMFSLLVDTYTYQGGVGI